LFLTREEGGGIMDRKKGNLRRMVDYPIQGYLLDQVTKIGVEKKVPLQQKKEKDYMTEINPTRIGKKKEMD